MADPALKQRIATALVAAPLGLALIIMLPPNAFSVAAAALFLVGAREFSALSGYPLNYQQSLLMVIQLVIYLLLGLAMPFSSDLWMMILGAGCAGWLLGFLRLRGYHPDAQADTAYRLISLIGAVGAMTWVWLGLLRIRSLEHGVWWIIVLLVVIWAADIGAYAAGRTFGRRKLSPQISPGKTWAGLVGALVLSPLAAVATLYLLPVEGVAPLTMALLAMLVTLASVGGDLYVSLHKRTVGIKDSGRLFPGHGGVLDRFDSLAAGTPFFALALHYLLASS